MAVYGVGIYDSRPGRPRHKHDSCEPPLRTAKGHPNGHRLTAMHTQPALTPATIKPSANPTGCICLGDYK